MSRVTFSKVRAARDSQHHTCVVWVDDRWAGMLISPEPWPDGKRYYFYAEGRNLTRRFDLGHAPLRRMIARLESELADATTTHATESE